MHHIIAKQAFNPIVPYDERNSTWVIHPTRTHLNSHEIANGYKGPINTLKDVADTIESGDKLLFCDGNYIETDAWDFGIFANNQQLVGMGDNVFVKTYGDPDDIIEIGKNLYFKNMKMEIRGLLIIYGRASVYMEHCEIVLGSDFCVDVSDGGTFHAKNCVFWFNTNGIWFECEYRWMYIHRS
eukprot:449889_1